MKQNTNLRASLSSVQNQLKEMKISFEFEKQEKRDAINNFNSKMSTLCTTYESQINRLKQEHEYQILKLN